MTCTRGRLLPVLLLTLLFVCLFSAPIHALAAIAVDVSGAANCDGTGACTQSSNASNAILTGNNTLTYTFTVGSAGTNRLLIASVHTVGACGDNNGFGAATTTSVTYGGQALTRIGTDFTIANCTAPANRVMTEEWYLVNPPTGSNNLVVTLSSNLVVGTSDTVESAFSSLTGVNQSTPSRGFNAANSGTGLGSTGSVTISSATNDLVWDSVCQGSQIVSTTDTQQVILNVNGNDACNNVSASTLPGAASVTTNWTFNGADHWADFASSIEPVAVFGRIIRIIGHTRLIGGVGFGGTSQIQHCAPGFTTEGNQCREFLTSGTTWTVPTGWNSSNNTIELIGGGGGNYTSGPPPNSGGGGGEYRILFDQSYTPGHSITIQIGQGGAAGIAGTASFIYNDSNGSIIGQPNGGSTPTVNYYTGGAGGTGGTGGTGYSGGAGGSAFVFGNGGGAGGGAGGPNGVGGAGGGDGSTQCCSGGGGGGAGGGGSSGLSTTPTNANNGAAGGNNIYGNGSGAGGVMGGGNLGVPGTAGTVGGGGGGGSANQNSSSNSNGGAGGNGTEWDASHGSGGGGGGGGADFGSGSPGAGAAGGLYGGGGGGGGNYNGGSQGASGAGANGIIVISYITFNSSCTGGARTTSGGNTVITFTSSGALTCGHGFTAQEVLVLAGGGSGSKGGGGAGGVIDDTNVGVASGNTTVTVGAGGINTMTHAQLSAQNTTGNSGLNSVFGSLTAIGGGGGGIGNTLSAAPSGGSGGGSGGNSSGGGGAGTAGQGNAGGSTGGFNNTGYPGGGGAKNESPSVPGSGGSGIIIISCTIGSC
jgi:hypothetical protein